MTDDAADWPFDQAPNVAAITVQAILDGAPSAGSRAAAARRLRGSGSHTGS
jgi:hypothetical protein